MITSIGLTNQYDPLDVISERISSFLILLFNSRIATDIVDERLQLAKGLGADVLINGLTENLHDRGNTKVHLLSVISPLNCQGQVISSWKFDIFIVLDPKEGT